MATVELQFKRIFNEVMKMRNGMEELKEDVRELKGKWDKIPSEVGTSTSMCSSRTQSLEERRTNYDDEFKHRRSTNLLQYLEVENLSEEVAYKFYQMNSNHIHFW